MVKLVSMKLLRKLKMPVNYEVTRQGGAKTNNRVRILEGEYSGNEYEISNCKLVSAGDYSWHESKLEYQIIIVESGDQKVLSESDRVMFDEIINDILSNISLTGE